MSRLRPFFSYFGAKWTLAPLYPDPLHTTVVEPFAGSAQYALLHHACRVWLNDLDEDIFRLWSYLIRVKESEILALPLLEEGGSIADLRIAEEAKILLGFWAGKALTTPRTTTGSWFAQYRTNAGALVWGEPARARVAAQLRHVRHWKVTHMHYQDLPNFEATWFIDPPYRAQGSCYKHGSKGLDFARLAAWCLARQGQSIVCEASGADWLPFERLGRCRTARQTEASEVVFLRGCARAKQLNLFEQGRAE